MYCEIIIEENILLDSIEINILCSKLVCLQRGNNVLNLSRKHNIDAISIGVTPIGQDWTNANGLQSPGSSGPKPDHKNSTRTLFTRDYVVTCESVHVITIVACCLIYFLCIYSN